MSIFGVIISKYLSFLLLQMTIPHDFPPGFQQVVESRREYKLFYTFFAIYHK